jgi:hypothetical protein
MIIEPRRSVIEFANAIRGIRLTLARSRIESTSQPDQDSKTTSTLETTPEPSVEYVTTAAKPTDRSKPGSSNAAKGDEKVQ